MAEYLQDGTFDFSFGQDAWHDPKSIRPDQYAAGVNVICRGSVLRPRPPFTELPLTFEKRTLSTKFKRERSIESIWRAGKFQAFIAYPYGFNSYIISVVCGLIFQTNVDTGHTILLSEDIRVNSRAARVYWSYAAGKIVIFDYPDYPVIIDGLTVTRSSIEHEINGTFAPQIPISRLGAYNQNRLFVANGGVEFTAGDPVGNLLTPEAPITFTEIFLPSSPYFNQFFSLPSDEAIYPITAMGFIQELDTNTGIGMLFVATAKKFFYFRTDQPRAQWTAGQFGGVLLANAGVAGFRSVVNVNSDLIFMSSDGQIYALSTSRNESKRWSNVPISREVKNYLKFNDPDLAKFATLGYFDNYIFITANPYRVQALTLDEEPITDYAHGGFVMLDIEPTASFLSQGNPVWDGIWTGVNPVDMLNIKEKCFIVSKDGSGGSAANVIYQLTPEARGDFVRGHKRPIRSIFYTKQYDFQQPTTQKRESSLLLHLQNLSGDVKLNIERKPTHSNKFLQYANWEHKAPTEECKMPSDDILNGIDEQQFKQIIFGDATEGGCNPITRDEYETFRAVQYRITIEGDNWLLDSFKSTVEVMPFIERMDNVSCGKLPEVKLPAQCEPDWLIPEETLCQK